MTIVDASAVRRLADMHAVYRMFDPDGGLLYVGRTARAGRFDEHAEKRWFPLVSVITLEWHPTFAAAVLAETKAIADEKPRYNIVGTPGAKRTGPRVKVTDFPDALGDVLEVFGDDNGLHWQVAADRLAEQLPDRWEGATRDLVRLRCRDLGVPTMNVRMGTSVRAGVRRSDVEQAVAQQVIAKTG